VAAAVNLLASAGVDVAITELDIAGASPADYTMAAQSCLLQPKCVSITTWGVGDAVCCSSLDSNRQYLTRH